MTGDKDDDN